MNMRLSFVAEAVGGERVGTDVLCRGVAVDSRESVEGKLFIPLPGATYDAHSFIPAVMERGASGFLWQRGRRLPETLAACPHIEVADTLLALQSLAHAWRKTLPVRVIGVTGSNGKTSTKDLVAAAMATRYRVYKTPGNRNSHIGLPLCVLEWDEQTEVAVLEMGMRGLGEIAELAWIASPEAGAITMIGEAHLERLGSRDNIARAKWELIAALPYAGLAVLPDDEPLLASLPTPAGVRRVLFGEGPQADVRLLHYEPTREGGFMTVRGVEAPIALTVPGRHQAKNALIALALADSFGIPLSEAAAGLTSAQISGRRLAVRDWQRVIVIDDSYNSAPSSLRAGLEVLSQTAGVARLAVLGDMRELGPQGPDLHEQIGRQLPAYGVDALITVGTLARAFADGARAAGNTEIVASVGSAEDALAPAIAWLERHVGAVPAVLCKGSNALGLSMVADALGRWAEGAGEDVQGGVSRG